MELVPGKNSARGKSGVMAILTVINHRVPSRTVDEIDMFETF